MGYPYVTPNPNAELLCLCCLTMLHRSLTPVPVHACNQQECMLTGATLIAAATCESNDPTQGTAETGVRHAAA